MTVREIERLVVVETQIEELGRALAGVGERLTGMDATLTQLRDWMLTERAADEAQRRLTRQIIGTVAAVAAIVGTVASIVVNVVHP